MVFIPIQHLRHRMIDIRVIQLYLITKIAWVRVVVLSLPIILLSHRIKLNLAHHALGNLTKLPIILLNNDLFDYDIEPL